MVGLLILGCSGSIGIAMACLLVVWEEFYPSKNKVSNEKSQQ